MRKFVDNIRLWAFVVLAVLCVPQIVNMIWTVVAYGQNAHQVALTYLALAVYFVACIVGRLVANKESHK